VYAVLGVVLWVAFLKSGVHATIAGVLLAMTIPAARRTDATELQDRARALLRLSWGPQEGGADSARVSREELHALERAIRQADVPLVRIEHALHPWVAFGVMPLFALANAGVALGGQDVSSISPVTMGVVMGLLVGKQAGVFLFSWLALRLGLAALPTGVTWRQLYGVSVLTGIGFTMSLFVAGLAFGTGPLLDDAKVGVLAASVLSGVGGWLVLRGGRSDPPAVEGAGAHDARPGAVPG
jgi:NhaA family Na+:H+ antiporter